MEVKKNVSLSAAFIRSVAILLVAVHDNLAQISREYSYIGEKER